ncbi:MAG: hypothetical protein KY447_02790 [Actinobacteria bacterium]|nr:hypothetical protein [Actinomycetota bacterium]MBW3641821.1 hypothetical protein [Actinomycetota bacterium]
MDLLGELDDPGLVGDERLAAAVEEIRVYATGPAPAVGPVLMAVLTQGLGPGSGRVARPLPAPAPSAPRRRLARRLQAGRARLVLGAAVASVGFLSAGAAGALPGPAQSAFQRAAIAAGIELPEASRGTDGAPGRSDRRVDLLAGPDHQELEANVDRSPTRRQPQPQPSGQAGSDASGADSQSPSAGGDQSPGRSPDREAKDRIGGHPLPTPNSPGALELDRGGPARGAPGPAVPEPPDGADRARFDGVAGRAEVDGDAQDQERPRRPQIPPGQLPGDPGDRPGAPAGAGLAPPR